ncbi:MAG: hypothetical protein CML41_00120 [Rhodobacteraceae bacterium]|nr:hypothetical protein [Paracoccaceae bacterium]MDC0064615.1 hypothetical protein [Gammaproteobacteria bacterium]
MNTNIKLLGEMVLAMLSADGRLSRAELRELKRIAPQYIDRLDRPFFDRFFDGFNGVPEFYDSALELENVLTTDEKLHYYNFFKSIAESDEMHHTEQEMLNKLIDIWNIKTEDI